MIEKNPFRIHSSVLIIKLRAIGDVVLSTPVISNLKSAYPGLHIDFLCEEFASPVVYGNQHIREVVTFNKKRESGLDLIQKIRSRKYDIVIDLFGNPRTALVTRMSGAKHRIGYPFRGRTYAYNHHVTPRSGEVHNVDFNLDVLRHFEIPVTSSRPVFPLSKESVEFSKQWIAESGLTGKKIFGLNTGGGWEAKKWDLRSFARLAESIHQEYGFTIVLFWGPGEFDDIIHLQKLITVPSFVIPKTTLTEMGALLAQCSYLVSNDSGPMHIAAALGVPTLGIYGPTDPKLQGPFGDNNMWVRHEALDCLACNLTKCPIGNICMTDLSADIVFHSVQQLITKNP